jgi:hypothetical protein
VALIFPRWTNRAPLAVGLGAPMMLGGAIFSVWYWFSPKYTDVGYAPMQPVPYSHKQHAGDLGIDCRYCHSTAEVGATAALPPTKTCMNCHAIVLKDSPKLEPVRASYSSGQAMEWIKVHMLPGYAYFDHSAHLAAGVGCRECHGRVDQMRIVEQRQPLSMSWCLECHRSPAPRLRPRQQITSMTWDRSHASYDPSTDLSRKRMPRPPVTCSGCHR